jgi:hypothetical protein
VNADSAARRHDVDAVADLAAVHDNQRVLGVMLTLHGSVHLVGFVLAWRLFEPAGFDYADVWPEAGTAGARVVGAAWLIVAVTIAVLGIRMANGRPVRVGPLVGAHAASVAVCATALPSALPGAVISTTVIGAVVVLALRRRARAEPTA